MDEKERLLKNIRESLSVDLSDTGVEDHPAVLAQCHYIRALEWVLENSHTKKL